MTLVEHYKKSDKPYEIMITESGIIHYDTKVRDIKEDFYMIEYRTHIFPAHIRKMFRWSNNRMAYQFSYSLFTGTWEVRIYDRGVAGRPYILKEPKVLSSSSEDSTLQYIIIEIIQQMRTFNKTHNVDIYNKDIEYLIKFIQEVKLYILE